MDRDHLTVRSAGYANLDAAKFVCALLVVFIHTAPLTDLLPIAAFYTSEVLARVAVPLFYAMTGFLFFGKLAFRDGKILRCPENKRRLRRYVKRTLGLYLGWSLVYILARLPQWYQSGWWGISLVKDCVSSVLFKGVSYHLWYLLALVWAVPVLYILMSHVRCRKIGMVIGVLWLGECLVYSYSWIGADRVMPILFLSQRMPVVFDTLLRAVPLLAVGALCALPAGHGRWGLKAAAALLLWAAEATALYVIHPDGGRYSYLLATPVMTYCALRFLTEGSQIRLPGRSAKLLRSMSLSIYCIHPLVIMAGDAFGVPAGVPMWCAVTVISVGIAYLWERMKPAGGTA